MIRVVFGCLLLGMAALVSAQDEAATPFEVYDDAPALARGQSSAWDGRFIDPGAVTYYDGQFHMFRNGFRGWPARVGMSYHTSDDGITWRQVSEGEVFVTEDVDYAGIAALASSVLVEADGTWVLYFYAWNGNPGTADAGTIGRATADNPLGPWTPDPEPILLNGSRGEWDSSQLTAPSVSRTDDGYVMYYAGIGSTRQHAIGMATSADGIHWAKYDDPTTIAAPYADSDPVMVTTLEWEGTGVHQPRVMQTDDGWVMVYRATGVGVGGMRLGVATSADGLTWTRQDNPVFAPGDVEGGDNFWFHSTAYFEGTIYLYVEIGPDRSPSQTNIYVATYAGDFIDD